MQKPGGWNRGLLSRDEGVTVLKKLLILGANPETARLVNKAKKLGIHVSVTDNLPASPAKKCADKAYNVDGTDVQGIVNLVRTEGIDGVLVGTADPLVRPYYEACKELCLPCYVTEKASETFSNKKMLKRVCKEVGIEGVPEYTEKEILNDEAVYPIVVKPSDGRSGKGITVCFERNHIKSAIQKAKEFSQNGKVIFERYMLTDDVFFYYTFYKGQYILSAMADRYTTKEQSGYAPVVLGATYPSQYMGLYKETLHEKMVKLFQYLGIRDGIFLMQAFVEKGRFYVYDPGFRFQGGAPHILMEAVNGLDQEEFMIRFALGEDFPEDRIKLNDPDFHGKCVGSQVVLLREGTIKKIDGIKKLEEVPQICCITQRLYEGDAVRIIGSEQQVLVRVHIVANDKQEFARITQFVNETVKAYDTSGKLMNLEGLRVE